MADKRRSCPALERFYRSAPDRGDPESCWLWTGSRNQKGYGRLSVNGHGMPAHRFSWQTFKGPIPPGLWVLHKCDTPQCVNPNHLFLGTPADNARDASQKGRLRVNNQAGTRNHRAKLDEARVRQLRTAFANGQTKASLAREFSLSDAAVFDVIAGRRWAHVGESENE